MVAKSLMFQGTGSDVGKSILVAGLCRAYTRRELKVLPFKPQNMSNNAAVTPCGGEIGRAQHLQALAARAEPTVHMNPVLLKPESDTGAQVVVHGERYDRAEAGSYQAMKKHLLGAVMESFTKLKRDADLVLIEGAGSPAEVNLRANDIANMGFALPTNTPVVLIGDINRGGVIAAVAGTHKLLPPEEQALIKGTIINLFRGDVRLFDGGLVRMEEETGWPNFGVVPFLRCVGDLPPEDAVVLEKSAYSQKEKFRVVVPMLPRIANFDDIDPLKNEENIEVVFCRPGTPLPRDADLIIIPGSKATIADLRFMKSEGWDIDILAHARAGGAVLGICGGYQMLGDLVADPKGIEGQVTHENGLGLLPISTLLAEEKQTRVCEAKVTGVEGNITGYEIHAGESDAGGAFDPFMTVGNELIGLKAKGAPVWGTYLHGLFENGAFRKSFFGGIGAEISGADFGPKVEAALDALADALEEHLDLDAMLLHAQ